MLLRHHEKTQELEYRQQKGVHALRYGRHCIRDTFSNFNRKNAFCLRGDELKLRKTSMHPVGVVRTNYGCKLRKKKTLQTEGKFIVKRNTLIRFVQYEFLTFQRGTVIKPACD